jgi:formylmethanofuran dehydrogenase subunit E
MQLHDVNAPQSNPEQQRGSCAICETDVEHQDAVIVRERRVCNSCVGDLLAQLAIDFRRAPRSAGA